jgi:hypothetical protein
VKLVREYINEKFTDESDPIKDMGIGIKHQIDEWIKQHKNSIFNARINKNLSISAERVSLDLGDSTELPSYIKFSSVRREFSLYNNHSLITLKGSPKIVGGYFNCSNCPLQSLEYSPKKAKYFVCWHNNDYRRVHKNILYFTYEDVLKVCDVEEVIYDDIGEYNVKKGKYVQGWGMTP